MSSPSSRPLTIAIWDSDRFPSSTPARIETVPVPNVYDGIPAYFEDPLERHVQRIFDLVDDDFGVGEQSRPQQDVDVGAFARRLRQLGFFAVFQCKLPRRAATAAIAAHGVPSAAAGTSAKAATSATTRPAGATSSRGLTHLLENPLPLLLAQRLNIPAS